MTGGQRIHDPVPHSSPPPANEAIVSGRSRQGAPERKTQKIPFRTRRSSTRGMPRGLFGRNDLMAAHSKSVSSYRMIRGPFGRLNHVQTDAFNRQNRTTGISEITLPDMPRTRQNRRD